MAIRIYDIENLPFGCQVTVKMSGGILKSAVVIDGGIAFKDGMIINFGGFQNMAVYLGWL